MTPLCVWQRKCQKHSCVRALHCTLRSVRSARSIILHRVLIVRGAHKLLGLDRNTNVMFLLVKDGTKDLQVKMESICRLAEYPVRLLVYAYSHAASL